MSAGDRRLFLMLEMMSRQHEVTLLVDQPLDRDPGVVPFIDRLRKAGVRQIFQGFWRMNQVMARFRFDVGIFEFFHCEERIGSEFRLSQPGVPVLVDSVDLHYVRESKGAEFYPSMAKTIAENKSRELRSYRESDGVVMVTAEDEQALKKDLPSTRTWLIPIISPVISRSTISRGNDLLFIGGFHHRPNVDGILWFAEEIWPSIRSRVQDASLTIVGSHPPDAVIELGKQAGICVKGFVPETSLFLEKAAVSIAPLRYGAGMKGKVAEALAAAVPVVTTSFGAQGFSAVSGEHLLISDDPIGFADHVVKLLLDPDAATALGIHGQELVNKICSPQVVEIELDQMLHEVAQTSRSSRFSWRRTAYRFKVLSSLIARSPSKLIEWILPRKHEIPCARNGN